ncbi:hypothetical protein D1794_26145 [Streptomyces clavuligerus]|nr:hypothetical protein D1794_26145 [Streptomyces clavuligerus]
MVHAESCGHSVVAAGGPVPDTENRFAERKGATALSALSAGKPDSVVQAGRAGGRAHGGVDMVPNPDKCAGVTFM